jgi:hypothetical protein
MSPSKLLHWAGLATLLSGILLALGFILHPPDAVPEMSTAQWGFAHLLLFLSALLGIVGIFGLYAHQAQQIGVLGLIGFILLYAAQPLIAGLMFFEAFVVPSLAPVAPQFMEGFITGETQGAFNIVLPLMGLIYSLGGLLFGLALFRVNTLPRWATAMTIIGTALFGIQPLLPPLVSISAALILGIGLAGLGYALWSEKRVPVGDTLSKLQGQPQNF